MFKKTPRILVSQNSKGVTTYIGRYNLKDGETHNQAIKELMKLLPNKNINRSHEDMTGAVEIVIY